MNKIFKISIYFILFVMFFSYVFVYYQTCGDVIWNYGFSNAIVNGEVLYKDFNLISTPLYNIIMSIGLFIYNDLSVFFIEIIIIYLFMFVLLDKLFKDKYIFGIFITILFSFFFSFIGSYNLLCIFLFLLLLYLEINNFSDKKIGFVIGLLLLTKHTIGIVVLLFSIIGVFDKKRIIDRIIGCFIPCVIFIFYLIIVGNLFNFIDLCILGLFSFSNSNGNYISIGSVISIILFVFSLYIIKKDRKNIINYYMASSICFAIPLFDSYHITMFLYLYFICLFVYLFEYKKVDFKNGRVINIIFSIIIVMFFIMYSYVTFNKFKDMKNINLPHFRFMYLNKNDMKYRKVFEKYKKYNNRIMIDRMSTFMDISSNNRISYFNVMLYGNWGYDIEKKVVLKLNSLHNTYIFINRFMIDCRDDKLQDYYPIYNYIDKNYELVDTIYDYNIYYKE